MRGYIVGYRWQLDTGDNTLTQKARTVQPKEELGIFKPGTTLFDPKKKINAKIMVDGSIKYKLCCYGRDNYV